MDEHKQSILRAMAQLMLDFCRDGVQHIDLHADVIDDMPYMSVHVWCGDECTYQWSDFPEEEK